MPNHNSGNTRISRREFLNTLWSLSLLGLFGQAVAAMVRFFRPRVDPGSFGSRIVAGQVGEFTPGTVSRIQKGRFYLSLSEDQSVLALWQRCTHLGCTIAWRESEQHFVCPCHSSVFDIQGEVVSGPAPRPMDFFPVEIEDGQIIVDTGQPTQRESFDPSQAIQV